IAVHVSEDAGHAAGAVVHATSVEALPEKQKRRICRIRLFQKLKNLEWLDVFCLPALGSLRHVKLNLLTLLQTPEPAGLNGREMDKNIFSGLTADKAVALGIVKPLHCSLFHMDLLLFLFGTYVGGSLRKNLRR